MLIAVIILSIGIYGPFDPRDRTLEVLGPELVRESLTVTAFRVTNFNFSFDDCKSFDINSRHIGMS